MASSRILRSRSTMPVNPSPQSSICELDWETSRLLDELDRRREEALELVRSCELEAMDRLRRPRPDAASMGDMVFGNFGDDANGKSAESCASSR